MLTIVTTNTGKYQQIATCLQDIIVCEQKGIDLIEPQSNDMLEVSAYKAKEAFEKLGGAVLVDDSGVFFDAYPDFPGVFSKYVYHSLGINGLQKLCTDEPNKKARHQCVLSYMDETLDEPKQFVGTLIGELDFSYIDTVEINPKLPFDLIMRFPGMEGVAQMYGETYYADNHRARAAQQLKERLSTHAHFLIT